MPSFRAKESAQWCHTALPGIVPVVLKYARWEPNGPPHNIEGVLTFEGTVDAVTGKPYTVRFDLDIGGIPIFRKDYFPGVHCVAAVGR